MPKRRRDFSSCFHEKALEHPKVEMSHCFNMRSYGCKSSMPCGGASDSQTTGLGKPPVPHKADWLVALY
ncbi:unnamed protein product [Fusarium venenatum]|uniref:Uncharacterized protein n=1 Tax=Fusarium venenatum TaxID=56646 RepID=A0A2L2T8Q6_9HYPO|nr:uncharacterized protein FVRRES_05063 [Fusarium venenatum]CEI60627.1 unnamed protein product [Fusarium venenatum]